MTEEEQGGTAPAPEATASADAPASEQTAAAIAVADEPAIREPGVDDTVSPTGDVATSEGDVATSEGDVATSEGAQTDTTPAEPGPQEANGAHAERPAEAAAGDDVVQDQAVEPVAEGDAAPTPQPVEAAAEPQPEQPAVAAPVRPFGPEPTTMEELLAEQETDIKSFKHGDVVEGAVVRIDKDEILVDIGAKSEGVVSNRELYGRHAETQPELNIGDTVLVYVLQPESPEGHVVLSLRRAGLERKWRSMQELFEAGTIVDAPVIDHNKGGLIVDCGIRGFVPISQIVDFPRRPQNEQPRDAAQEIAEKLQPYVGRKLRLKILEVNRKANRLILSEKVALYEERREKRDELFSSLQVGQKVTGNVRSIAPFGIFIDLGGIDGLVHKSELSWNKVNNPEAGYKVGDEVEAEVIDINHERGRISLSIRRLQPDPWESTVADFKVGDIIDGTVTKLVNFGAFVRVREGLEGLIHISELSHQRVAHPGDVVHEGQVLKLKIISLDSERHRLGLSLKQAEEPPVRSMPEPGMAVGGGERRERRERRERPDRGFSPSQALSEPEGGIDTTLAAAFAQVRDQLAAAEAADDVPASAAPEPEAGTPEPEGRVPEPAPENEAVVAPAVAGSPEATAKSPDAEATAAVVSPQGDVADSAAEAATTEPEAAEAETTEPEAAEAETTEPEAAEAETTEPEAAEAETTEPEAAEAETTEPEAAEAETTEPEAAEAETTEPEAAEAETTEPEAAEAETTEPEAAEAETTEPEAAEAETTEPEAAEAAEERSEDKPA